MAHLERRACGGARAHHEPNLTRVLPGLRWPACGPRLPWAARLARTARRVPMRTVVSTPAVVAAEPRNVEREQVVAIARAIWRRRVAVRMCCGASAVGIAGLRSRGWLEEAGQGDAE